MTKLETAHALVARGFEVFPIAAGAKAPPLLNDWPHRASEMLVDDLWGAVPDANIGIHCKGMVVVDIDVKKDGDATWDVLEDMRGAVPTLTTRTPSGGRHLFYRLPAGHPGVGNTVGKLGRGLDTRSTGGYVVAPGSDVPAGRYHFEGDAPIAAAPQWLLNALGAAVAKAAKPEAPVPDALPASLQRAREWLVSREGAVEGQGGDAHTYATACMLRDLGASEAQCFELLMEWNATCSPPWDTASLKIKAHNAYRYAQEATAGGKVATAAEFPVVQTVGTPPQVPTIRTRAKALRLSAFVAQPRRQASYLIKEMLPGGSYIQMYGAPGEGKTFVALDMAYHVAAGKEWMGHKTHGSTVLYLAYEGAGGIVNRAKALHKQYGDADVPLYVAHAGFNLRKLEGRNELGALMATLPEKPKLVVIDTFARAMMGGDENSAQDVGEFNDGVAALMEFTGGSVMIIHHSGKNKAAGARGSSALLGAIDTEIEIDSHQIETTKQRDIEIAGPIGFRLVPVTVGMDEDGDAVTSCVVECAPTAAEGLAVLTGNARRGFDVLCEAAKDNAPMHTDDWHERCKAFLGEKSSRQRFHDLKKVLVDKGYVVVDTQGRVTRRLE